MKTKTRKTLKDHCGECGQLIEDPRAFHPFLYCQLYKLGYRDQERALWSYGFQRRPHGGFGLGIEQEPTSE